MVGILVPPCYSRWSEINLNSWVVSPPCWFHWGEGKGRTHTRACSPRRVELGEAIGVDARHVHEWSSDFSFPTLWVRGFLLHLIFWHAWRSLCWPVLVSNYSCINSDYCCDYVAIYLPWLCHVYIMRVIHHPCYRLSPHTRPLRYPRLSHLTADMLSGLGEKDLRSLCPFVSLHGVGLYQVFGKHRRDRSLFTCFLYTDVVILANMLYVYSCIVLAPTTLL
jgi:hypothetical protein